MRLLIVDARLLLMQKEVHRMEIHKDDEIRRKAEEKLKKLNYISGQFENMDLETLIHELTVHQIELDMQNDELRRTHEELQVLLNKFSYLFDFAPVGYFIFDDDSKILRVNNAGASLLGSTVIELTGSDFTKYIHPDSQDVFYFHIKEITKTQRRKKVDIKVLNTTGELHHTLFDSIPGEKLGEQSHTFLTAVTDVTQQKILELELVARNAELQDFSYRVSHNLKNPISMISGFLSVLKDNRELFDEIFPRIENRTIYMTDFINNLLKLTKSGRIIGEKQTVNLLELLNEEILCFSDGQINISLTHSGETPIVFADRAGIREIISNLLQNSLKYLGEDKKELIVTLSCISQEKGTIIKYSDNGSGIGEEHINKVFLPGYSATKSPSGGFGLSIVKKIVDAHGWNITVDSEGKDMGVIFSILVPK